MMRKAGYRKVVAEPKDARGVGIVHAFGGPS